MGHQVAQDAAGAYAALIAATCMGVPPIEATHRVANLLKAERGAEEVIAHLDSARGLAGSGSRPPLSVDDLPRQWRGYVAEEALAIGVYCALAGTSYVDAIRLAVNHGGSSDSAGAICGGLFGAHIGSPALPEEWLLELEGRGVIARVAEDIARIGAPRYRVSRYDDWRYPGV